MALFFDAESCHQEKAVTSCSMHPSENQDGQQEPKGCCDDKTEYIKSESEQFAPLSQLDIPFHPILLSSIIVMLKIELTSIDSRSIQFFNYKPPLIVFDLTISLQKFLR